MCNGPCDIFFWEEGDEIVTFGPNGTKKGYTYYAAKVYRAMRCKTCQRLEWRLSRILVDLRRRERTGEYLAREAAKTAGLPFRPGINQNSACFPQIQLY